MFFIYYCSCFTWQWYLIASIIGKNYIHIWYRSCVDSNIQIFVGCVKASLFPSITWFRIMRCSVKKNIVSYRKNTNKYGKEFENYKYLRFLTCCDSMIDFLSRANIIYFNFFKHFITIMSSSFIFISTVIHT